MKAIVLAAGFSTRLYPLTKYFPKALLPIKDKALMDYMLLDLTNTPKIEQITFVTNHLYFPLFNTWLTSYYQDKNIQIIDNGVKSQEERLGAIGDLQYVLDKTGWNDDLLVVASDTLALLTFADFISFFAKNQGVVTAIYNCSDKAQIKNKLGCAVVEGEKLVGFLEKPDEPPTSLKGIPYYIFPKEALLLIKRYIKEGNPKDAPGSILGWLIGKIPTYAYNIGQGYYYDVGTIEVYNQLAETF